MANYHTDEWVMNNIKAHYNDALQYFPEDRIVGIFCQGSTNYGLDTEHSDIDTKLVVLPTFEEIAFNRKPHSTTHIRENEEHIDFKDLRLMLQTFRKQNLNFLEILFTPYKIVNPLYEEYWNKLVEKREKIAHYDICQSLRAMKGVAMEKYHAMEHRYPSKLEILDKFGYDPKQLHHLFRIEDFLERYINGESYENCMNPKEKCDFLKQVKSGCYDLETARCLGKTSIDNITEMVAEYLKLNPKNQDSNVDILLDKVQYDIMKLGCLIELKEN